MSEEEVKPGRHFISESSIHYDAQRWRTVLELGREREPDRKPQSTYFGSESAIEGGAGCFEFGEESGHEFLDGGDVADGFAGLTGDEFAAVDIAFEYASL